MSDSGFYSNKKEVKKVITMLFIPYFSGCVSFFLLLSAFSFIILNVALGNNWLQSFVLIASGCSIMVTSIIVCCFTKRKRVVTSSVLSFLLMISEYILILGFNHENLINMIYLMFPVGIISDFLGLLVSQLFIKK